MDSALAVLAACRAHEEALEASRRDPEDEAKWEAVHPLRDARATAIRAWADAGYPAPMNRR